MHLGYLTLKLSTLVHSENRQFQISHMKSSATYIMPAAGNQKLS